MNKKILLIFLVVVVIGNFIWFFKPDLTGNLFFEPEDDKETGFVTKVIDGDTVVLSSGQTLRYIGMDTPEREDCFFEEAKRANEELVLGEVVKLEKDVSETDKYKRLLRYVWARSASFDSVQDGGGGGRISTNPFRF